MTDLVTTARGVVEGLLPAPLAASVRIVASLGELLEQLAAAERQAEAVRVRLNYLIGAGAATSADYLIYNRLRRALYRAQSELYGEIVSKLPAEVADQLPSPSMMPAPGVHVAAVIGAGVRGLGRAGLGTPPAAAAPAAPLAMAPWMWAVAAIALLVGLGLLAVIAISIATSAAAAATVGIASRYAELAEQSTAAREAAYNRCIAGGTSPAECAEIARQLVPTPVEQLPDIPNPLDGMASAIKWTAVAIGLSLVGYFGWHFVGRSKRQEKNE